MTLVLIRVVCICVVQPAAVITETVYTSPTTALLISKESGNLVGLISPSLGEGMFLVLVLSLETENAEEMVAFQKYEITDGRFQVTIKLSVNEIKGVCPFS